MTLQLSRRKLLALAALSPLALARHARGDWDSWPTMKNLTISSDRMTFLEDGRPWVQRGTLDWPIYGRFLNEGELYAKDLFIDRRSVGANTIACAGMLAWPQWGFNPSHPDYWSKLRRFVEIADDEGMRLQFVVLCDTASLMPDLGAQKAHWERFLVTLGDKTNVSFVVANQPGHPTQTIRPEDTATYTKPSSFQQLLCARNNPFETDNPVMPPMDFSLYCSSRDGHLGYVEVGSSMWYVVNGWPTDPAAWGGTRQVSVLFEPARIEAGTQWGWDARPSNGWDDPGKWRQLGRSLCFKGTGGGNIYSRHGVNADLLTSPVIRACYVEFLGNIPNP